jgi:hypothetical protein
MKKILLPLLLILAVGMLAAVESEPSEVVGYVKYNCYNGFNYVALPMGDLTTAEVIGNQYLPTITAISKWMSANQSWTSINYDPDFGEWDGTIPVTNGDVIVMFATSGFSFYSLGNPLDNIVYNINPGYNYISVPLNLSVIHNAETIGNEIGNISAVSVWSNLNQSWLTINYDPDFGEWDGTIPVGIGDVVVLYGTSTTSWPTRNIEIPLKDAKSFIRK